MNGQVAGALPHPQHVPHLGHMPHLHHSSYGTEKGKLDNGTPPGQGSGTGGLPSPSGTTGKYWWWLLWQVEQWERCLACWQLEQMCTCWKVRAMRAAFPAWRHTGIKPLSPPPNQGSTGHSQRQGSEQGHSGGRSSSPATRQPGIAVLPPHKHAD